MVTNLNDDLAFELLAEILNPEPLDTGYYVPTVDFVQINEHRAVMRKSPNLQELIAITGPGDDDKSLRHAQWFAGANMLISSMYKKGGGLHCLVNHGRLCFCSYDHLLDDFPSPLGHSIECDEMWQAWEFSVPYWPDLITKSIHHKLSYVTAMVTPQVSTVLTDRIYFYCYTCEDLLYTVPNAQAETHTLCRTCPKCRNELTETNEDGYEQIRSEQKD